MAIRKTEIVTGFDGKKKKITTPRSQLSKGKVKENAYPSDEKGKQRLAENADWANK